MSTIGGKRDTTFWKSTVMCYKNMRLGISRVRKSYKSKCIFHTYHSLDSNHTVGSWVILWSWHYGLIILFLNLWTQLTLIRSVGVFEYPKHVERSIANLMFLSIKWYLICSASPVSSFVLSIKNLQVPIQLHRICTTRKFYL